MGRPRVYTDSCQDGTVYQLQSTRYTSTFINNNSGDKLLKASVQCTEVPHAVHMQNSCGPFLLSRFIASAKRNISDIFYHSSSLILNNNIFIYIQILSFILLNDTNVKVFQFIGNIILWFSQTLRHKNYIYYILLYYQKPKSSVVWVGET